MKRFRILSSFWEVGGDALTPTMKLKRRVIAAKYADVIAEMYEQGLAEGVYEPMAAS